MRPSGAVLLPHPLCASAPEIASGAGRRRRSLLHVSVLVVVPALQAPPLLPLPPVAVLRANYVSVTDIPRNPALVLFPVADRHTMTENHLQRRAVLTGVAWTLRSTTFTVCRMTACRVLFWW
ncbi:hypothetical protein ACLB1T_02695 [Escherichia coli]